MKLDMMISMTFGQNMFSVGIGEEEGEAEGLPRPGHEEDLERGKHRYTSSTD